MYRDSVGSPGGAAVLERPTSTPKTDERGRQGGGGGGGGIGGGGGDGGGGGGGSGGGGGYGGGGSGEGNGGGGGRDGRVISQDAKFSEIGTFSNDVLKHTLNEEQRSRVEANPFASLMMMQNLRTFIASEIFPFKMAWDLNSKDLMWYLTMDQVLDNKWQIEPNILNEPKDENYVLGNIIKDVEEKGFLTRVTQMQAGRYCFVSQKKVIAYIKDKIQMSPEGKLLIREHEPDLAMINGTDPWLGTNN